MAVVAVLAVGAAGAATVAIVLQNTASNQREADRRENIENLCVLLNEQGHATGEITEILVEILHQQKRDVNRLRETYRRLGITQRQIERALLRSERNAVRLENARPSQLTCENGHIRRKPPAPISAAD